VKTRLLAVRGGSRATGALPLLAVALAALFGSSACSRGPRFANTFDSPRALAAAVLAALESKDRATLEQLPLSEAEFREEVFPEMPAWGKIPMTYVWEDLRQKSANQIARLTASLGGRAMAVEDVVFDGGATAYKTFVVHRKPRLVVTERPSGRRRDIAVFGSVIECDGRYKLFSYVVNR
jgi:hypothetical protein